MTTVMNVVAALAWALCIIEASREWSQGHQLNALYFTALALFCLGRFFTPMLLLGACLGIATFAWEGWLRSHGRPLP
jgi:hypothetical protein